MPVTITDAGIDLPRRARPKTSITEQARAAYKRKLAVALSNDCHDPGTGRFCPKIGATIADNSENLWCYEATLGAFGIHRRQEKAMKPWEVREAFEDAGYSLEQTLTRPWEPQTVGQLVKANPKGDFVIWTQGHIMALRDNVLTDTEEGGPRRKIIDAYKVTKSKSRTEFSNDCHDPETGEFCETGGTERYFGDYKMEYMPPSMGNGLHTIVTSLGDAQVAKMMWSAKQIEGLDVQDAHQRKGIARAMWEWGQEMRPKPKHSNDRTNKGDAWAKAIGGKLPRRLSKPEFSNDCHDPETGEFCETEGDGPDDPADYRMDHQPPDPEDSASIAELDKVMPEDVYDHPEFYDHSGGREAYDREAARILRSVRGKPDAIVTIYRAAPPGRENIEKGNWVTISEKYARQHAMNGDPNGDGSEDWPVYAIDVPAKDVFFGGNDIVEQGYWGDTQKARIIKPEFSAEVQTFANSCHDQLGRFCETEGHAPYDRHVSVKVAADRMGGISQLDEDEFRGEDPMGYYPGVQAGASQIANGEAVENTKHNRDAAILMRAVAQSPASDTKLFRGTGPGEYTKGQVIDLPLSPVTPTKEATGVYDGGTEITILPGAPFMKTASMADIKEGLVSGKFEVVSVINQKNKGKQLVTLQHRSDFGQEAKTQMDANGWDFGEDLSKRGTTAKRRLYEQAQARIKASRDAERVQRLAEIESLDRNSPRRLLLERVEQRDQEQRAHAAEMEAKYGKLGLMGMEALTMTTRSELSVTEMARLALKRKLAASIIFLAASVPASGKEIFANDCHDPDSGRFCETETIGAVDFGDVRGQEAAKIKATLATIARVHGIPAGIPTAKLKFEDGGMGAASGIYTHDDNTIHLAKAHTNQRFTFAHEYGHFLSLVNGGILYREGFKGNKTDISFFSRLQDSPPAVRLWEALRDSDAFQAVDRHAASQDPETARYGGYLRETKEIFARAYSQYIATHPRARDADLRDQFERMRFSGDAYSTQWTDTDFEPIAEAFDGYFEHLQGTGKITASAVVELANPCHSPEDGRFCETPDHPDSLLPQRGGRFADVKPASRGGRKYATPEHQAVIDAKPGSGRSRKGSAEEMAAARALTARKIADAPVPSREKVKKNRAEIEKVKRGELRPGGEHRGNVYDRRNSRLNLFDEFGGFSRGYVVDAQTGLRMHWADPRPAVPDDNGFLRDNPDHIFNPHKYPPFERGKIMTHFQGGGYQQPNLIPESFSTNRARSDTPVRPENQESNRKLRLKLDAMGLIELSEGSVDMADISGMARLALKRKLVTQFMNNCHDPETGEFCETDSPAMNDKPMNDKGYRAALLAGLPGKGPKDHATQASAKASAVEGLLAHTDKETRDDLARIYAEEQMGRFSEDFDPYSGDTLWYKKFADVPDAHAEWLLSAYRGQDPRGRQVDPDSLPGRYRKGDDPVIQEAAARQATSRFIKSWARGSNDTAKAYAIQEAAKLEFKLTAAEFDVPEAWQDQYQAELGNVPTYRKVLRTMHTQTQGWLATNGITSLLVQRGFRDADAPELARPMASWTTDPKTATRFSENVGAIVKDTIPASRIIGTPRTGFGSLPEFEVVVLADNDSLQASAQAEDGRFCETGGSGGSAIDSKLSISELARLALKRSLALQFAKRRGNPEALISYWREGKGADRIAWGTDGDFTRCMKLVGKYLPEDAGGFCQNRHMEIFGESNAARDAKHKKEGD